MQKKKNDVEPLKKNVFLLFLGFIPLFRIAVKITSHSEKRTYWLFCILPLFSTERFFDQEEYKHLVKGKH